jgi:MFS family permease
VADSYAALRIPVVRDFAIGRVAAVMGIQIMTTAVGWQLYERTGSAWSLGMVGIVELAPVLILMLPAGQAADRYPRRHVAMFAHALIAAAAVGLGVISFANGPVWAIYALLTLFGVARAFASPSVGTLMPQLLEPAVFANANAWLSSSFHVASIAGPALGGGLIALTGDATWAYVATAAGQLTFILMLRRLPLRPPQRSEPRGAEEIFAGFGFIRRHPVFLAAMTLDLFAVLLGGAVALLPIFAKDILAAGPSGLGWLRAAPSLGAFVMALAQTRLPAWRRPGAALLVTVAGFGLATIGFGLSRSFALSLVCLALTGAFDSVSVVIRMTLEQVLVPDRLRGRVSALHYVFIGFSNELGAFESGATAALFGPIGSVVGGGIGTLVVIAVTAFVWPELPRIGPLHTLVPAEEPQRQSPT